MYINSKISSQLKQILNRPIKLNSNYQYQISKESIQSLSNSLSDFLKYKQRMEFDRQAVERTRF